MPTNLSDTDLSALADDLDTQGVAASTQAASMTDQAARLNGLVSDLHTQAAKVRSSISSVPTPVGWALNDSPNFKLLRAETWQTDAARGEFLAKYSGRVTAYPKNYLDTNGKQAGTGSHYDPQRISVSGGVLSIAVETGSDGKPGGANPYFVNADGSLLAPQYGRFQVVTWADPVKGYKRAFMGWPKSWVWNDGEMDFVEGSLDGSVDCNNHFPGDPQQQDQFHSGAKSSDRHVWGVEFIPSGVSFYLDGKLVGTSSGKHNSVSKVPTKGMFLNLQTETNIGSPQPSKADKGAVYVGPVGIWQYTGS